MSLLRGIDSLNFIPCPEAPKGSPFGRAGAYAPERARTLTEKHGHSDNISLAKILPIAVRRLHRTGLALSVTFGDTSPKGRGFSHFRERLSLLVAQKVPTVWNTCTMSTSSTTQTIMMLVW